MRKLLFHRDFRGFSGGHLKVWDYFKHTKQSAFFKPEIYLSPCSLRDALNPWFASGEKDLTEWKPVEADALFLAGLDWLAVPEDCAKPVINLVQGLRHALPEDPRYAFLRRRATRICVSQQVADAIVSTGQVNGPVVAIPNGLDLANLPVSASERDIPVLIAGYKEPHSAESLSDSLRTRGIPAFCLTKKLPRSEYLSLVARSQVTVFLPNQLLGEGFYLPALEGMALGTLVVCPDCVGNRDFCIDGYNCFMPEYSTQALSAACLEALYSDAAKIHSLQTNSRLMAELHKLEAERKSYLGILEALACAEF
jgi:glycosyltransferase involved in cell wall biosynthesis